jgi:hypothetical protein
LIILIAFSAHEMTKTTKIHSMSGVQNIQHKPSQSEGTTPEHPQAMNDFSLGKSNPQQIFVIGCYCDFCDLCASLREEVASFRTAEQHGSDRAPPSTAAVRFSPLTFGVQIMLPARSISSR